MRGQALREKLHRGDRVYGTHVCSLTNPVTAKMTTSLEIDFVFICNEHMPIDRTETAMMCQFYAAHGIAPIVRIPYPHAGQAAMVLDGGAQGVLAPYVETVQQVRDLVGAVHYRPIKGQQLADVLEGRAELNEELRGFLPTFNRDHLAIIGVESMAAVERLEELIGVPGVDAVFLGPHDLTVSMGLPERYGHPAFVEMIEDVIRRCRKHHVGVGLHTQYLSLPPDSLRRYFEAGMNYLPNGADITTMLIEMNQQLAELRRQNGDVFERSPEVQTNVSSCIAPPKSAAASAP
jgi:4-hydroxy-2-oxoheptanedioate aldolase